MSVSKIASSAVKEPVAQPEFDWIKLRDDMDRGNSIESQKEKLIRKITENPLVPTGCIATATALGYGLWCFRVGNKVMSQRMMRVRIVAQGFTVAALVGGIYLASNPTE